MMRIAYSVLLALVATAAGARGAVASNCEFKTDPLLVELTEKLHAASKELSGLRGDAADKARKDALEATVGILSTQIAAFKPGSNVNRVTVDRKTRVSITLTNPTPERLRVSFDTRGGGHHEVEWDPAVSSNLARVVTLEPETWAISVTSDPQKFTQQSGVVIIQVRFGWLATSSPSQRDTSEAVGIVDGQYVALALGTGTKELPTVPVALRDWPQPRLTFDCNESRPAIEAETFATPVVASGSDGLRGFGVAPTFVTDTLAILAEIAIDRARSGALEVLKRRLVDPFCVAKNTRITLSVLRLGAGNDLALPRTCELLQSLRIDDVLASGRPLLIALRDDLRLTIAPAVADRISRGDPLLAPALRGVISIMNSAIDRGGFDGIEGQLVLELIGGINKVGIVAATEIQADVVRAFQASLANLPKGVTLPALGDALGGTCGVACTSTQIVALFQDRVSRGLGQWRFDGIAAEEVVAFAVNPLVTTLRYRFTSAARQLRDAVKVAASTELSKVSAAELGVLAVALHATCAPCTVDELGLLLAEAVRSRTWHAPVGTTEVIEAKVRAIFRVALRAGLDAAAATADDRRLEAAIRYACEARLIVAVVKRCSGGSCSATELSRMLDAPKDYFAPEPTLPQALCWQGLEYVTMPGDIAAAQRLVIEGLKVVAPVVDGQGRERAKGAIRLLAEVLRRIAPDEDGLVDERLDLFAELATAIVDEDYGTAFGRFLRLARAASIDSVPKQLSRFAQLIGAVASYAAVYRSTKDENPSAARDARKRALSAIIDSFTNRGERGGERIVSLGSNVGLSGTWTNVAFTKAGGNDFAPAVRVPLALRFEWLGKPDTAWWRIGKGGEIGVHAAVQLIDLGQFVRNGGDDQMASVRWADFVSPGLELGFSHAKLDRALNLTLHAEFAPAIRNVDPAIEGTARDGVWRFGIALSYYVPFVDLD